MTSEELLGSHRASLVGDGRPQDLVRCAQSARAVGVVPSVVVYPGTRDWSKAASWSSAEPCPRALRRGPRVRWWDAAIPW